MDYTLHEWVRMASHHGSIARCAIEKQAEESGLDALAVPPLVLKVTWTPDGWAGGGAAGAG